MFVQTFNAQFSLKLVSLTCIWFTMIVNLFLICQNYLHTAWFWQGKSSILLEQYCCFIAALTCVCKSKLQCNSFTFWKVCVFESHLILTKSNGTAFEDWDKLLLKCFWNCQVYRWPCDLVVLLQWSIMKSKIHFHLRQSVSHCSRTFSEWPLLWETTCLSRPPFGRLQD